MQAPTEGADMRDTRPRYDLAHAIDAHLSGHDSPMWRASYERVESDETAELVGFAPSFRNGWFVPLAVRDMSAATGSGGGFLVGADTPGGMFLESLQGASIAARLGVQILPMGRDNGLIPIVTTPPTTQWLPDDGVTPISTAQPVIGSRPATPKAVAASVTFSRQLLTQSRPAIEKLLMRELARAVAAAVDHAVFNGTGASGQPTGLLTLSGTATASGATIAWSSITDMIEDATTAGAAMVSPGFACDGPTREVLMNREIAASSGVVFTQDAAKLAGFPLQASKSGPAGALIFCDFSEVFLPTWSALELMVDPYSLFSTGRLTLRAILYVDTLVAHAGAIAIRTSVS
jgi:HK97 family phage major capsid protein